MLVAGCAKKQARELPSLYSDVWLRLNRGDLTGARAECDAAQTEGAASNTEWSYRFRILKAEILWRQGLNDEALALLNVSLPVQLAKSDTAVWQKITEGGAYSYLGRYKEADEALAGAELLARMNQPDLLGQVALRRGTLDFLRDDAPAARSEYLSALGIARNLHDPFLEGSALGNLGLVSTKLERYDESIGWNQQALELSQTTGAHGSTAVILGNMGWSYVGMGDYDSALSLFEKADEASGKSGSLSAQLDWKINIGNVYLAQGKYYLAEKQYQNALVLAKRLDNSSAESECFENLALVSLAEGQVDSAQKYNEEVPSLVHSRSDMMVSTVISGRIHAKRQHYKEAEALFESVISEPDTPTSLRWEAQARLAEVYAFEGDNAKADQQFRRAIDTFASARYAISSEELRLSFLSNAISFYDDYIEFLISQGKAETALQVAEVSRAQTLAEGLGLRSKILFPIPNFQPRAIAQRFGATLLFYWLGEKHSYLWAITTSGVSLFTLPPASEIELALKSYREALLGPRDVLEASNAQGLKLYDILVAPAQKLIAPGSRVIILPDAGLYGLNFETLLNPKPQVHYWIEDSVVANANSLVLLAASANQPVARAKKLLLVGNPISPSAEFPDLPQAGTEMTDVERYFAASERTVLSRQQATASAYLESKPVQYSFIHFVAHGTASRASPLDSAVILSKQGDSYKLYARDIVTQPLHANLVTISACHGTGERTYSGEGLVGLTWAFLRAGAHGVIAALWEVNDNSTPELMDDLYAEIQKGSAPEAALHHAKLKLLNSGTVYQKPFYWAPFEIYLGH
ncbi:MAG TPA: CHAT domain-containing tetratricopeptide repeat protein [Candidatus Dormibacteraeota bacterium]|nr:CHAT domain-containing tetratricopeptide repeat protein [Candidatus Dormibacteraeota bacterium]